MSFVLLMICGTNREKVQYQCNDKVRTVDGKSALRVCFGKNEQQYFPKYTFFFNYFFPFRFASFIAK